MPVFSSQQDSRLHPPTIQARLVRTAEGKLRLESPTVGLYRGEPRPGSLVTPESSLGQLEILGVLHHLLAPAGASGLVVAPEKPGPRLTRRPVGHGDPLVTLDPEAVTGAAAVGPGAAASTSTANLVFRAPTSGRWYTRPGPGKPPLIEVGAQVQQGQAVGLIEVMKTFSRLHYGGEGLPSPARIRAILVKDEEDVAAGDALFELET
ncbi:MAG TPA: biotin/lipoyl-containing protein [Nannocystis sp.]|jgi:acetyl-CoA carboxylase biotin carboxyl carrier protein